MRKLFHLGFLLTLLLTPVVSLAQGSNGGIIYPQDFAQWNLPQGTGPATGTLSYPDATICRITSQAYNFTAPRIGRPLTIVDQTPGLTEPVPPSQVIVGPQGCIVNALMAHQHYSYTVRSGTAGLQEAIDYNVQQNLGALVVLTPAWTAIGGTTGMITSANGSALVSIIDERTSCPVPYTWSGSAYVAGNSYCAAGGAANPAGPSFAVQLANSSVTAFQADSSITINPTTHTFTAPIAVVNSSVTLYPEWAGAVGNGIHDDTAAFAATLAACPTVCTVQLAAKTYLLSTGSIAGVSNLHLVGSGRSKTVLQFTSASPVDSGVSLNGVSNVEINDLSISGASSPATLARAIKVNNSQNISLHDLNISGGGWEHTGLNPHSQVAIQGSTNVTLENSTLTNDGGDYVVVTDYFSPVPQITSSQVHIRHNVITNTTATISISGFQCQFCDFSGNDINEGNRYGGANNDGYAVLSYQHPAVSVPTTGATVSGTTNLTLTFPANTLPTTPLGYYLVTIAGISTCTGTQPNGTFTATIMSPTTVTLTSTGSTCSAASLAAGTYSTNIHPAHVTTANNRIWNTAGSSIYYQTSDFSVIANNTIENGDQQQGQVSLPAGCIALNAGNGVTVSGNAINGCGEAGIDATNPNNLAVTGNTITGAIVQGMRFGNVNGCHVVGNTVTGSEQGLFVWNGTNQCEFDNVVNTPSNVGFDAESDTTDNTFKGIINGSVNHQGYVDAGVRNHWDTITCNGCFATFSGTDTTATNGKFYNLSTGNAINLSRVNHLRMKGMHADTVAQFLGTIGASNDVTCDNCTGVNLTDSGYADSPAVVFTGTVASSSCTITALSGTTMLAGQIISDYNTGALIPSGSTIVSVNIGAASLVFSNPQAACATGSATETLNTYAGYVNGLYLNNFNIAGNFPSTVQGIVTRASQNIHIAGGSMAGFYFATQAVIDLRGVTCTLPGQCSVGDGLKTDSAGVGYGFRAQAQVSNLTVNDAYFQNTGDWAIQDIGTGTGNTYRRIYQNAPSARQFLMTNTNSLWASDTMFGTGAPSSSLCVAATRGYFYRDTSGNNLYVCDGTNWSAPLAAGVSAFSGDGTLISNSSSTGPVAATLANAGAHTVWGNRTGSTAAPGYAVLASADIPNNAANTSGNAANLAGGALGSAPYQSALDTTAFIPSPTTSAHQFFYGWAPSGSAIAPTSFDLGTYLNTNITASLPLVFTPTALGFAATCPTCGSSLGGTAVTVNGGGPLASLDINATAPVADASFLALTPKISGGSMITEAPYGSSSDFGVLKCGTGITCAAGVATSNLGTVTSVTFTGDGVVDSATPSAAVTGSGTVTATVKTQTANTVLAGPTTGSAAASAFRALVSADIPSNAANTSGNAATATALASSPTNCSAGNAPRGINASGVAQNCTAYTQNICSFTQAITVSSIAPGAWTSFTPTCTGAVAGDIVKCSPASATPTFHGVSGFDVTLNGGNVLTIDPPYVSATGVVTIGVGSSPLNTVTFSPTGTMSLHCSISR